MVTEQETLIYIEDQDKKDASIAAKAFAHEDVKNRAYINTLGAELALKYLASENIDVSNVYNIHSIKKILEEMDISDIMLPNIHIDVRVVFDENVIFIPKSHFEYNIEPDIYLVFNLAKDFSHVKFLGFFEPRLINKNNSNDKYYFIEKEKLNSVVDLKKYIETHKGNTKETLSQEDIENSERIIIAMADNDISENDKKYLIKQLTKSAELRDKFIEYENFETLSYKAMNDPQITRKDTENNTSDQTTDLSLLDELDNMTDIQIEKIQENTIETENNSSINEISELNLEPIDNIEDLTFENNKSDKADDSNLTNEKTDSSLTDIGDAVVEGLAAGATAAAASEILNTAATAETPLNLADTTLDVVNSGIEFAKDLITENNNEKISPINFDNIEIPEIDPNNITEENSEDTIISLDNVETPNTIEKVDFIDSIDNKISFDNIEETIESKNEEAINIEENTISLNNIEIPDMPEVYNNNLNEDFVSLDNIETIDNSNIIDDQNVTEEFENIANEESNNINQENIENTESENDPDINSENLNIEDNLLIDNFDDTELNNDDFNFNEILETDIDKTLNNSNEQEKISDTQINIVEEEPNDETNKTEGFGKNLMDNLSLENIDDISIEKLLSEDESDSLENNTDDISSEALLSQADELIDSNIKSETDLNKNNQEEDINDSLNDIPTIEDITETNNIIEKNINIDLPTEDITNYTNIVEEDENNNSFDEISTIEDLTEINNINSIEDNDQTSTPDISEINDTQTQNNIDQSTDLTIDDLLNLESQTYDNSDNDENQDNDKLDVLFDNNEDNNDNLDTINEINENNLSNEQNSIPGAALYNKTSSMQSKKAIIVATALVTIIAATSAFIFLKPKNNDNLSTTDTNAPTSDILDTTPVNTPPQDTKNILENNTPDINKTVSTQNQKKELSKEIKNNTIKKSTPTESVLDVKKLVWDVPNNLSYNTKIQNYLRSAGKSIKLRLSADLLLTSEYAYTNQVKVSLILNKDGSVKEANISNSSGSNEIDKIVLQSVKDTLNVVKPPSEEIKTPDFNLNLIIYF